VWGGLRGGKWLKTLPSTPPLARGGVRRGDAMPTWSVQTRTGLKLGLTAWQLEVLLRSGAVDPDDAARADGAPEEIGWTCVGELPWLARQVRVREKLGPTPAPDPAAGFDAMLGALSDEGYRRQLRRLVWAARAFAVLALGAEVAYFARYLVGDSP
jgi:hypothetical protein